MILSIGIFRLANHCDSNITLRIRAVTRLFNQYSGSVYMEGSASLPLYLLYKNILAEFQIQI